MKYKSNAHYMAMNQRIQRRADRTEPSFTVPKPSRCEENRDNRPTFTHRETIIVWMLAAIFCIGFWYGAVYAGCGVWVYCKGIFA